MKTNYVLLSILLLAVYLPGKAQTNSGPTGFIELLKNHLGKSYEGQITAGGKEGDGFTGKKLVMTILQAEDNLVKVPFYVGDDYSRTWIFNLEDNRITLKHDHRKADGNPDEVTFYGGTTTNVGTANLQVFPADQETVEIIPAAATNVWWVEISDTSYSYNLRRIGSDRVFTVSFDLTQPIAFTELPWGWNQK